MAKLRLAYLVTHPIPYQAPLLRMVAAQPDIELKAFFGNDFTTRTFTAEEFRTTITWDVPLLEGYDSETLPRLWGRDPAGRLPPLDFWNPLTHGFAKRLSAGKFDALWVHGYAHWQNLCAMGSARLRGVKVLLRDEATAISAQRSLAKRFAKRAFFAALDRLVDAYLPIGALNRRYYQQHGIADSRLFTMPYAVDNARFQAQAAAVSAQRMVRRAELGITPDQPVLLFVAKLIDRKRPGLLLDAFARVHGEAGMRRPVLLYCGDGPLRGALEEQARALPPGAVRLLGFQKQNELPSWYDLCDAFVLPSAQESWGLVVNEVMNAGRAVICSDQVGASYDLVKPGENGAVFKVDDVEDCARAIRDVIGDGARLAAMGRASRALIDRWSFAEDVAGLRAALAALCPGRFVA
jgi:glycosyltransferase involved in cell wall biosynthesis